MIELNSETDFVARNEEFKKLAHEIAHVAAAHSHDDVAAIMEARLPDGQTIRESLDAALAKMRENLVLRRSVRYEEKPDSVIVPYVHTVDNKTGVLVELAGDPGSEEQKTLARNIAMHIAFAKPRYLRRDEVPAEDVERERQVLTELTRNE